MRTKDQSQDVNHGRRRLIGAAAVTLAAAPLGLLRSTSGIAAPLTEIKPGTNTAFAALKQIDAGVLNVGYAEVGPADAILGAPAHPYTRALLSAVSEADPRRRRNGHRMLVPGEIPSPRNPPPGCRFHTRCPYAEQRSREEIPQLEEIGPGHVVACHFWEKVRAEPVPAPTSSELRA